MYYIYESDKPNWLMSKLSIIKKQGNTIILPINRKGKTIEEKKEQKLAQKTIKIMQSTDTNKVVLSKEIQKHNIYVNQLYTYGLNVANGKWLFFMLIPEILEYILKSKMWQKEKTTIHILVNDINENIIKLIKILTRRI